MLREDRQIVSLVIAIVVVIVVGVAFWVAESYFEARAYKNVTGKEVSTWDAMWLDLRVQDSPR